MKDVYRPSLKTPVHILLVTLILQLASNQHGYAQACTGVLGGAVVNQTFGSDAPYQLRAGQTTYQSVNRCPNDGECLITPGTTCYGDSWHALFEDHTLGDTKGNMLIVNAAQDAGEFYNQPVSGLCYGTTYEFSAWIINMVKASASTGCSAQDPIRLDPNVTMRVELPNGRVLQTITTGSVPRTNEPVWVRYATVFTLPTGENSVVIKLTNNAPGGCGNDLALDDIQLRPCRPQLGIRFSDVEATTLSLCEGSTATIRSALGSGYNNPDYQWQTSTDSISWRALSGASEATYDVQGVATGKRFYRLLGAVGGTQPGGSIDWDTTCSTVSNTLIVQTLSTFDCELPKFYVPDAFTPNNDGINDRFRAFFNEGSAQLERFQLRVYNRWGSVIFTSTELTRDWDGTYNATTQLCSSDVYTWVIDCRLTDANQVKNFTKEGRVLLIR